MVGSQSEDDFHDIKSKQTQQEGAALSILKHLSDMKQINSNFGVGQTDELEIKQIKKIIIILLTNVSFSR